MGIDCYIKWDSQTESELVRINNLTKRLYDEIGIIGEPSLGHIRERYGLVYHFTPFLFKEAWNRNNYYECHITSQEFRRRYKEVLTDLKTASKLTLLKKYTHRRDPIKDRSVGAVHYILRTPSSEIGKHQDINRYEEKMKDSEEEYHKPKRIKIMEEYYSKFANYFEALEKDGKRPYVTVWY